MPFLRLTNVNQITPGIDLNVVRFREEALAWLGETRRAFAGNLLSTQRDPKRSFTATVEFLTTRQWEDFRKFIAGTISVLTGQILSIKPMWLLITPPADPVAGRYTVRISLGAAETFEYRETSVNQLGWSVELTFEET